MSARVSRRQSRIVHQRRARFLQVESLEQRSLMATLSSYLTNEHADLSIGTNGSSWTISPQNSDEFPAVQYSSEDGLLYVGAPSLSARPSGAAFDFIGVNAGDDIYRLPQSQDPNLLYLGFAGYGVTPSAIDTYNPFTESKGRVNGNGRWIKASLLGVQHTNPDGSAGTGRFSVWQSGDTGPAAFISNFNDGVSNPNGSGLDATDGISADDGLWLLAGGHLHYNFGFTQKGRYEVTLKTSAYFGSDGNNSTPNTADYRESGPIKLYFSVQSVGRLEFDASSYTVNEGAGTASVLVRRVEGSDGRLTVNYGTSNGSAAAPGDYTATSGTLTFEDGETQKTIVIPILEDLFVEGNETLNLTLSAPGPSTIANYVSNPQGDNSSLLGPQATALLTIVDNDSTTNSAPTISNVLDMTTAEDVTTGAIAFTVGDDQTAAGALAVTATSSNTSLVPNTNILLGGSGANRTVTLTPAANQFGTTTITLTVTDAGGLTATDTFLVTVDSVNDLPTISDLPNQTTLFSTPVGPLNFTIGDTETTAVLLTVSAVSANPTLVPNANLALGGSGSNRTLTVTPATGQSGTTTITVTVTDTDGGTRTDTFDLTVGANAPPTVSDIPNQSTSFNAPLGPLSFTVGDTETAANLLSVSAVSSNPALVPNANLMLGGSGSNRTLTVTPATGQSGTTTITVTVTDADGGTRTDTFDLTVGANAPPTISDIPNQSTSFNTSLGPLSFTVGDTETAANLLNVTAVSSNPTLVPNANLTLGGTGTTRTLTLTPATGQSGTTTITVTVADANGGVQSDTFELVVGTSSLPTISEIANLFIVESGSTGPIAFTINDSETAATDLVVTATSSNTTLVPNANITLGGSGANRTIAITPALNQSGLTTITLTVTDGGGLQTNGTFVLTVGLETNFTVAEDSGPTTLDVLVNDTLGRLTITAVATGTGGNIEIAPDGRSLIYVPNADFYGTEWLLYTVTDEHGSSSVTPLTITVLNTPDAPTATADIYSVDPARSVFGNVLFNDTDADGDSITATLVTSPTRGALTFASDGSFRYTPGSTFVGTDSFTYSANDGGLTSGIVTVTINLAPSTTFDAYLTEGHADVGVAIGTHDHDGGGGHEEAEWDLHVHDEERDVEYEPQKAVFVVGAAALTSRPASPAFDFVGVNAGQNYYRLAETENPELPYLGLGTEEIEAGTFLTGTLTLRLKAVNGPGHFSLWKSGDTGPEVFMTTSDGITAADHIDLFEAGHTHANWGFSARGTYEVVFQAFGTLADGDVSSSEDVSYFFTVNSTPEAEDDAYSVDEEGTLTVGGPGVLGNDTDPDGDSLVSAVVQGPANGTVTLNPDGSFTYVPNANFSGTDTFTYAVTDQRYRLIPLGTLGGNNSFANDVNNLRQVTGNSSLTAGSSNPLQAYLWENGSFTPLGVLPGTGSNNFSRGYAVNDDGVVVGESDNSTSKAFVWDDGVMSGLIRLAGDNFNGVSNDINNGGVIVGSSSNGTTSRPTIWTFNGATYVAADLGTIAGTMTSTGRAWAINEVGQVVGLSQNPEVATSQATLWDNGAVINLGSLGDGERFSQAYGVNNLGDVVGASSTGQTVGQLIGTTSTTSITRAFFWHEDHFHELLPFNFYAPGNTGATTNYHSEAKDINDAGMVVGNSSRISGSAAAATLWDHGAVIDLNALTSNGAGWVLRSAEGINQGGDIVGFGSFGGFTRAFMLVPEVVGIDGRPFSETATVTITVNPTADPPVAADDAYQTEIGDTLRGNVVFNDADPDGDALSVVSSTPAAKGTVVVQANGSFVYTPNATFAGADSFTYTVSDGAGGTDTATVNITLAALPDFEVVLSEGHADIGVFAGSEDTIIDHGDHTHVVEGEFGWDLHVHDHESDEEYHAEEAQLLVRSGAITARPAGAQFDFIGVGAGEMFWRLPQTQNPNLLFLGLGSEEIEDGTFAGGKLSLRLVSVNGPGHVSVWKSGDTGPEVLMATADGVTTGDLATLLEGGHEHVNWGFTASGQYEVTFQAFGTLPDGTAVASEATTYYFDVAAGSLNATLNGSVLSILDTAGNENSLEIHTDGGWLVITDPTEVFGAAPPGAVLSNGNHTLSIPLAGLTALQVDAAGGADLFELGNTNGLPRVTLLGGAGDDEFLLPQLGGLTNVILQGGLGSDTFGSPTQPIRLSNQATVQLSGDDAGVASNPGGNVTDHLYLDLNTTAEGAASLPLVIVDTVTGQASTANTNSLRFGGIDDIDLFDDGSLTDVEIGDLYVRAGNQSEMLVFYSEQGGVRASYNGMPASNALFAPTKRIVAYGRGGNDVFEFNFTLGSTLRADFRGEAGNDTLVGGLGDDTLVGGGGSDILRGGEGNDTLFGEDFLTTTSFVDAATQRATGVVQSGTIAGNDNLQGGGGNDTLFGGGGDDVLAGGLGDDYIHGGDGNDILDSNNGNDVLRGEAGSDLISGGTGTDIILGGSGDDRIFGRGGRDFMLGGIGADQLQDDDSENDVSVSGSLSYDADNAFTLLGASLTGLSDNDLALQALMFTGANAWNGAAPFATRVGALNGPFGTMINDTVMDVIIGTMSADDFVVSNAGDWQLNTEADALLTL